MRAVTGPRVQLLCVDASPRLLVFGSSIGSVYVFERRARDGEALDADAEPDAANADAHDSSPVASHAPEDGPARFLERFMVETFAGGSATRPVTRARLDERRARVALAFDDGEVVVTSFRDPLSSERSRVILRAIRSRHTERTQRRACHVDGMVRQRGRVDQRRRRRRGFRRAPRRARRRARAPCASTRPRAGGVLRFRRRRGAGVHDHAAESAAPRERVQEDAHRREAARRRVRRERARVDARGGSRGDARATGGGGGGDDGDDGRAFFFRDGRGRREGRDEA